MRCGYCVCFVRPDSSYCIRGYTHLPVSREIHWTRLDWWWWWRCWCCKTTRLAAISCQAKGDASLLASRRSDVQVVAPIVASRTGRKVGVVLVHERTTASNRESRSWCSPSIALKLGGWTGEDTTTTALIGEVPARVDTVLAGRKTGLVQSVLAVWQLFNGSHGASQMEAAVDR